MGAETKPLVLSRGPPLQLFGAARTVLAEAGGDSRASCEERLIPSCDDAVDGLEGIMDEPSSASHPRLW